MTPRKATRATARKSAKTTAGKSSRATTRKRGTKRSSRRGASTSGAAGSAFDNVDETARALNRLNESYLLDAFGREPRISTDTAVETLAEIWVAAFGA